MWRDINSEFFPGTLPRPFFRAWPTSVVERESNVTLKCGSPFQRAAFRLGKLNSTGSRQQLMSSSGKDAELLLTDLQPQDAGRYFCTYKTTASQGWSESEHLQLVVTGSLPKPSLSFTLDPKGHKVTLQCLIPYNGTEHIATALLKSGHSEPLQVKLRITPADLVLWTVTIQDTGNYSCVYYQWDFPYLGSFPSSRLEFRMKDEGP
ncbi:PREDICTED: T-cell-interacting, activating receptor on myeloid cells protein 1 [Chrysochloris asiatica]|uniref:T-cell-interacting, activating receptor on myeloid cells protein 1 n=1 Tax=Chrysochloris asiatica TaxID=185453 RepID=UPI0003F11ACA|nr:PREDICTED: T-cell-interacting, activating receptor on myeloid cells protein 1 [Chrysochloris asiatica]